MATNLLICYFNHLGHFYIYSLQKTEILWRPRISSSAEISCRQGIIISSVVVVNCQDNLYPLRFHSAFKQICKDGHFLECYIVIRQENHHFEINLICRNDLNQSCSNMKRSKFFQFKLFTFEFGYGSQ